MIDNCFIVTADNFQLKPHHETTVARKREYSHSKKSWKQVKECKNGSSSSVINNNSSDSNVQSDKTLLNVDERICSTEHSCVPVDEVTNCLTSEKDKFSSMKMVSETSQLKAGLPAKMPSIISIVNNEIKIPKQNALWLQCLYLG